MTRGQAQRARGQWKEILFFAIFRTFAMDTTLLRLIFIQNVKKGKNQPTLLDMAGVALMATGEACQSLHNKIAVYLPSYYIESFSLCHGRLESGSQEPAGVNISHSLKIERIGKQLFWLSFKGPLKIQRLL
jgi:hypothetical protein